MRRIGGEQEHRIVACERLVDSIRRRNCRLPYPALANKERQFRHAAIVRLVAPRLWALRLWLIAHGLRYSDQL